jgi:hypothetical protein
MAYRAVAHITLTVSPLRVAQACHRDLFAVEVALRKNKRADGWSALPLDANWEDAEGAGFSWGGARCIAMGSRAHWTKAHILLWAGSPTSGAHVDAANLEHLRAVAQAR